MSQYGLPKPGSPSFPEAASQALDNTQLRKNIGHATRVIREKRAAVVGELPDWEALREAGREIKSRVLANLTTYLSELEASVARVGGQVHWARDAGEAAEIVKQIATLRGAKEIIKIKSLTTDEIELNTRLEPAGIRAWETDLAELIIQLAGEPSSHILVPAIHKNRSEIRELFRRTLGAGQISDEPRELAKVAREHLRRKFLSTDVAVSGVNFAAADTGTVCIVESEGNGRMCLTLPKVLVSVMGIEKILPSFRDFEIFLQLLPRSSTGERMNPYTSLWTGITKGDGPEEFHLVLLDNGRTRVLADPVGRQTLYCIRCSACLNICPVYERTGGHAYQSVYPGPIGAILTPQLVGVENARSLPYASSLCGACYEVCPVKINIPEVLVHLRGQVVAKGGNGIEGVLMRYLARVFASPARFERLQRWGRRLQSWLVSDGVIERLPGELGAWTRTRDLHPIAPQTFREWWRDGKEGSKS